MLYKLKLLIYKNRTIGNLYRKLFGTTAQTLQLRCQLISKYVPGKSFIDVGCMWGVNGYFSFLAEELGAKAVTAFDIYPENAEFQRVKKARNSKVRFVQGDINSQEIIDGLGEYDVVFCAGLLYHVPDPIGTLLRLRKICSEILIIGTCVIPEMNGIQNTAVLYPFLTQSQRKLWNLEQGVQLAIKEPYDPNEGYSNWIWGFSSSCLESMVQMAGFRIVEKYSGRFYTHLICRKATEEFLAVSGASIRSLNHQDYQEYKLDKTCK